MHRSEELRLEIEAMRTALREKETEYDRERSFLDEGDAVTVVLVGEVSWFYREDRVAVRFEDVDGDYHVACFHRSQICRAPAI